MPAGQDDDVREQLAAPATLKAFAGQGEQGAMPPEPKVPARHGRESTNVLGPEEYPDKLSIANVIDPLVAIGETAELRWYPPPPNFVELVFGPRKIHKASYPRPEGLLKSTLLQGLK